MKKELKVRNKSLYSLSLFALTRGKIEEPCQKPGTKYVQKECKSKNCKCS